MKISKKRREVLSNAIRDAVKTVGRELLSEEEQVDLYLYPESSLAKNICRKMKLLEEMVGSVQTSVERALGIAPEEEKKPDEVNLYKINQGQRWYILTCGSGYTCLGFDVCEERKTKLAAELEIDLNGSTPGTQAAYDEYTHIMGIAAEHHRKTGWRSESQLTPQLIGCEGYRVEVVTCCGGKERFIVGKSTGYVPCHIALHRRDSSGGYSVIGAPFRSVRNIEHVRVYPEGIL